MIKLKATVKSKPVSSLEEVGRLIAENVQEGALVEILTKDEESNEYLFQLIIERDKLIMIKGKEIPGEIEIWGEIALQLLKDFVGNGAHVNIYPLNNENLRALKQEHSEVIGSTPKILLREIFRNYEALKKPNITITSPLNLREPLKHLAKELTKESRKFGYGITSIVIETEEIRMALGSGKEYLIEIAVKVTGEGKISLEELKKKLENLSYKWTNDLSKVAGERCIVRRVEIQS